MQLASATMKNGFVTRLSNANNRVAQRLGFIAILTRHVGLPRERQAGAPARSIRTKADARIQKQVALHARDACERSGTFAFTRTVVRRDGSGLVVWKNRNSAGHRERHGDTLTVITNIRLQVLKCRVVRDERIGIGRCQVATGVGCHELGGARLGGLAGDRRNARGGIRIRASAQNHLICSRSSRIGTDRCRAGECR